MSRENLLSNPYVPLSDDYSGPDKKENKNNISLINMKIEFNESLNCYELILIFPNLSSKILLKKALLKNALLKKKDLADPFPEQKEKNVVAIPIKLENSEAVLDIHSDHLVKFYNIFSSFNDDKDTSLINALGIKNYNSAVCTKITVSNNVLVMPKLKKPITLPSSLQGYEKITLVKDFPRQLEDKVLYIKITKNMDISLLATSFKNPIIVSNKDCNKISRTISDDKLKIFSDKTIIEQDIPNSTDTFEAILNLCDIPALNQNDPSSLHMGFFFEKGYPIKGLTANTARIASEKFKEEEQKNPFLSLIRCCFGKK